jgi:hypothetical protein
MSSLAPNNDHAARRLAAQRVGIAGRSRRADAGTVTEMARLLLRDAREAHTAEARTRGAADAGAVRAARRELASASGRLSSRPLAARRA